MLVFEIVAHSQCTNAKQKGKSAQLNGVCLKALNTIWKYKFEAKWGDVNLNRNPTLKQTLETLGLFNGSPNEVSWRECCRKFAVVPRFTESPSTIRRRFQLHNFGFACTYEIDESSERGKKGVESINAKKREVLECLVGVTQPLTKDWPFMEIISNSMS